MNYIVDRGAKLGKVKVITLKIERKNTDLNTVIIVSLIANGIWLISGQLYG